MSLTIFRTNYLLVSLLAANFDLTQASPTLPVFKPTNNVLDGADDSFPASSGLDSPSLLSLLTARTVVSSNTIRSTDAPESNPHRGNDTAAIIGGTVATGIIVVATIFVGFAIYKQCLARQSLLEQKTLQDGNNVDTTTESNHKEPNSFRQRMSYFFRRPVSFAMSSAETESIYSDASSSAESTVVHTGAREPFQNDPAMPIKAAKVLGLGDRAWHPRRHSNPAPPLGTVLEEHPLAPPKRRGSGCTMSTLGMDLLRDTMQTPEPQKFVSPPIQQTPWQPRHERKPSQDLNSQEGRLSNRRYFIPMLSPSSPGSPRSLGRVVEMECMGPEVVPVERRVPEVSRVARTVKRESGLKRLYSMGGNKL
ncbi:Fc.00g041400.m01.CDS01 [Cosmosporella sp. VM-42]